MQKGEYDRTKADNATCHDKKNPIQASREVRKKRRGEVAGDASRRAQTAFEWARGGDQVREGNKPQSAAQYHRSPSTVAYMRRRNSNDEGAGLDPEVTGEETMHTHGVDDKSDSLSAQHRQKSVA